MPEGKLDGQLSWQLEVQLVHAEAGSRIVLVQLRQEGQILDAALGEAATAELAEDRARPPELHQHDAAARLGMN